MKLLPAYKNITGLERWLSILSGGAVAIYSAKKRQPIAAALGAILISRGITGKSFVYSLFNINTKTTPDFDWQIREPIRISRAVTINRPPKQIYDFWRSVENLPLFFQHLDFIQTESLRQSHWVATGASGHVFEWDVIIETDIPNEMISWHSTHSDLQYAGFVQFEPTLNGQATNLRFNLAFTPPVGKLAILAEKIFGDDPKEQISQDLRAFKRLMELGNVIPMEDRFASGDRSRIEPSIDQRKNRR